MCPDAQMSDACGWGIDDVGCSFWRGVMFLTDKGPAWRNFLSDGGSFRVSANFSLSYVVILLSLREVLPSSCWEHLWDSTTWLYTFGAYTII
jgi:hypothetical protein